MGVPSSSGPATPTPTRGAGRGRGASTTPAAASAAALYGQVRRYGARPSGRVTDGYIQWRDGASLPNGAVVLYHIATMPREIPERIRDGIVAWHARLPTPSAVDEKVIELLCECLLNELAPRCSQYVRDGLFKDVMVHVRGRSRTPRT